MTNPIELADELERIPSRIFDYGEWLAKNKMAVTEALRSLPQPLGDGREAALEEAAKLCDAEEAERVRRMDAAGAGSWEWGEPKASALAQGHKAITAQGLAKAIRSLKSETRK